MNAMQPPQSVEEIKAGLERSGGLVWNGGWKITKKGEALLSRLAKASA